MLIKPGAKFFAIIVSLFFLKEIIKNYKSKQIEKLNNYIKKNISHDLAFSQKNLFYFIFVPLITSPFRQNFKEKGFKLKTKQANYYSLIGFIFFALSSLFLLQGLSNLFVAAFWIAGFMPAYLMDEFFNRQRQIKKLQRLFGPIQSEESGQEQDAWPDLFHLIFSIVKTGSK